MAEQTLMPGGLFGGLGYHLFECIIAIQFVRHKSSKATRLIAEAHPLVRHRLEM